MGELGRTYLKIHDAIERIVVLEHNRELRIIADPCQIR